MPDRSYTMRPIPMNSGGTLYQIYEAKDGYIGFMREHEGSCTWQTDLRTFRIAQQLQGTAESLKDAQEAFKQAYEAFRSSLTDERFEADYKRPWKA